MPHIILKHSKNIKEEKIDYKNLFKELSIAIASDGFCNLNAIKCYKQNISEDYINGHEFFIHIDLLILARENKVAVENKVKIIQKYLKEFFNQSYKFDRNAFTLEVRHMDHDSYYKGI